MLLHNLNKLFTDVSNRLRAVFYWESNMADQYLTVVYVLKDDQQPSDILKGQTFGEDYIFASVGDCTKQDEDDE